LIAAVSALFAFTGGSNDAKEATDKLNDALERLDANLQNDLRNIEDVTDLRVAFAKKAGKLKAKSLPYKSKV
jgi:hypothetical protein